MRFWSHFPKSRFGRRCAWPALLLTLWGIAFTSGCASDAAESAPPAEVVGAADAMAAMDAVESKTDEGEPEPDAFVPDVADVTLADTAALDSDDVPLTAEDVLADPEETSSPDIQDVSSAEDTDVAPPSVSFDHVWEIGPGHTWEDPSAAPWEDLEPSTLVRIHWRATPYAHKWVIGVVASEDAPVVVRGVPGPDGQLPVITGDGAQTRQALDYWNEERSVIKLGGASVPASDGPAWVTIEGLEVRSAHPAYQFTDDKGASKSYANNAAAVHIETGSHLTIRGCRLHDSGNGLFAGSQSVDLHVDGNHVWGNGNVGSIYEHNSYVAARGILYEHNRYGPLRDGAGGNNLKDRSAAMVVRYNWIEGGNRQLDLVDTAEYANGGAAGYDDSFVYGNVLIEPEGAGNSQIVHWGGDSGDPSAYRSGTLHFFHNTVVSTRLGNTTLLRLSADGLSADVRNNVVHATAGASRLAIFAGQGTVDLRGNWLTMPWKHCHCDPQGSVTLHSGFESDDPGFASLAQQEFLSQWGIDGAVPLADAAAAHPVDRQYTKHQASAPRPDDGAPDIGAFEHPPMAPVDVATVMPGTWLLGWHGGLDHFSWVRLDPLGDGGTGVAHVLDPGSNGALVGLWPCSGEGGWGLVNAPGAFQLFLPESCDVSTATSWFVDAVSEPGEWPEGPLQVLSLSTGDGQGGLSAYRYPDDWCDAEFTTCQPPW